MFKQRALAAARGSQEHDELAAEEIEIDAPQGVHVDLAHVVSLGDPPGGEDRFAFGGDGCHAASIEGRLAASQTANRISG